VTTSKKQKAKKSEKQIARIGTEQKNRLVVLDFATSH